MTLSNDELWKRVQQVVERHGRGAPLMIAARIEQLAGKGNEEGVRLWTAIGALVHQLRGEQQ